MSYCPDCGNEVASNAMFCESCGSSLQGDQSQPEVGSQDVTGEDDTTESEGINWKFVGAAILFALLPAFGAYMLVSVAANVVIGVIFFVTIPIFAYLFYQRRSIKSMGSGMLFWLAIEAFLMPLAAIIYTFAFSAAETSTEAEQAGAAIGGGILTVMAFVIGIPVGLVLYLLSGRLEPDESD